MHFPDFLPLTTLRIIASNTEGNSVGTGFIYKIDRGEELPIPILITNKHVVESATSITLVFHTLNNGKSGKFEANINEVQIYTVYHPDNTCDLAAILLGPFLNLIKERGFDPHYNWLDKNLIARSSIIDDISPLDPIVMVGYPNGIWDQENNLPIFRQGVIASVPDKDFNGKPEFLIDCACFPGSSGSPVFLYNNTSYYSKSKGGMMMGGLRVSLLGVLYAGPQHSAKGEIVVKPIPTSTRLESVTSIPNNIGYCIKANMIDSLENAILILISDAAA